MNSMSSVTVAEALAGHTGELHLADDAFHLFSAPAEHLRHAETVTLTGGPALTFRQMAWLFELPNFAIGPQAHVRLSDTLGNTVEGVAAHADWLRQVEALEVQLAEGRIAAAPAAWLASLQTPDLAVVFMPFARGGPATQATREASAPGSTRTISSAELLSSGLYAEAGRIIATHRGDLTVTDATVADLELLADLPLAGIAITVTDEATAISADLSLRGSSAILALLPHVTCLAVSDGAPIVLTATQALTGGVDDGAHSALALARDATFEVTDARVTQLGALERLPVTPARIEVSDSAEAVIGNLPRLVELGAHVRVTLRDRFVRADQVAPLALLSDVLGGNVRVCDTGPQLAALAREGGTSAHDFLRVHGAILACGSIVTVLDMIALAGLPRFGKAGHRLTVWDTVVALTAVGTAEILRDRHVDEVFLRTGDEGATLSAAAFAALCGVAKLCLSNPDGSANRVGVSDSAPEIDAVRHLLSQWNSALNFIDINANGVVSATTFGRLQALGATASLGVCVTVRDTASAIAAAPNGGSTSVKAASWVLSGSAIVSVADAVSLGQRKLFSAGPYSLTLAGDAVVSASEASALAALGPAFTTGGHALTVRDGAASLAGAARTGVMAIATSLTLAGPDTARAATAEAILPLGKFRLTSALTILDDAAHLLSTNLRAALQASNAAGIQVRLLAPETLSEADANILFALPGFADPAGHATVSVRGDATVSTETIMRGAEQQVAGGKHARARRRMEFGDSDAASAVAALSAHVTESLHQGGPCLALTAEALAQPPSEFASLTTDFGPPGEHIAASVFIHAGIVDASDARAENTTAQGTINVYGETGMLLSATAEARDGFVGPAPPRSDDGQAFSITESVDGRESGPVVVLDGRRLASAVHDARTDFAPSGAIQVENGKYLDLYTRGNVPVLQRPALVYDPGEHSIGLAIPGQPTLPLVVLGGRAAPALLDSTEILVRKAS
jgi:hypothetical protein